MSGDNPSGENRDLRSNSITDVKQLGTFSALASLSYVFWVCGGMEMVERLAFYGIYMVRGLYARAPVSEGGLGLDGGDIGIIFSVWALVQSWVPVGTGGISDRLGYKESIFASTVFKIMGYLIMAWFASFWGFLVGAIVLAFGTGIFKPGIQGTIAMVTNRQNSSVAWGVFYQTINIGGFLGPIVAGMMRQMAWDHVFYACAAIISLNFILLLTYKEVGKEERLARREKIRRGEIKDTPLIIDAINELTNPVLMRYILLFTGFWFMLYVYWDLVPLYFEDWVDTTPIVQALWGDGQPSAFAIRVFVMDDAGTHILPEGLNNLNAFLIMTVCFLVTGFSARLRAANSMAIGTFLAALAIIIFGGSNIAWIMVAAIAIFSLGEMLSSPKFLEYMGNIAPDGKKAMYLGFSQLPLGIGWTLEGYIGQYFYGTYASKEAISRLELAARGWDSATLDAVPNGEAFDMLLRVSGGTAKDLTAQLYASHQIGTIFFAMASVGILAAIGLYLFGRWTYRRAETEKAMAVGHLPE
ncbi:MAG: MFS transporter [Alphaproteobacteria bacterium]|nr:MAG: MFS transporter [Alphaproteobacteria bacterium]